MKERLMYIDNSGTPWPTAMEAQMQDERQVAAKIIQEFAELANSMRERLQDRQPMMSLADVVARMTVAYERHVKPTEVGKNVGHHATVDGGNAPGDAGSDASSGISDSASGPS